MVESMEKKMIVYVIEERIESDKYEIRGIFKSQKLAEKIIDLFVNLDLRIDEYEIIESENSVGVLTR